MDRFLHTQIRLLMIFVLTLFTSSITWAQSHSYINGFCIDEDCSDKYEPAAERNGWYEIQNAGQLYWFAEQVDNGNPDLINANVRLINDIIDNDVLFSYDEENDYAPIATDAANKNVDVNTLRVWNPIGIQIGLQGEGNGGGGSLADENYPDKQKWFGGHFDGQGYSISGLYFNDDTVWGGLFAMLRYTCNIENVKIENCYFKGLMVGSIAAHLEGGLLNNCHNNSILYGNRAGGIVTQTLSRFSGGTLYGESNICNCVNGGTVYGKEDAGGIVGLGWKTYKRGIFSCLLNLGKVTSNEVSGGIMAEVLYGDYTINSCFSVDANKPLVGGVQDNIVTINSLFPSDRDFHNGKVAYSLSLFDEMWGQDLSQSESIPSYGGAKVHKLCGENYTNDVNAIAEHSWKDGVCTECDDKQEAIFNTEKNSYEISNLGQLLWFDERFGLEGPKVYDNANAFLTSDITINNATLDYDGEQNKILVDGDTDKENSLRVWKTLGSTHNFEGNGHTISGLYALTSTYSRNQTGFCNGEVLNLTLSNAVVIATSDDYIGGFAGITYEPLKNCHFKGVVIGKYVGGIACSSYNSITNCSFEGKNYAGKGGSKTLGGLVGKNHGSITNCAFLGECINENKIVRLVGTNSGTISNCFLSSSTSESGNEKIPCTIVDTNSGTIQKIAYDADKLTQSSEDEAFKAFTTEQIKSGEVAYWLNDNKSDGTQVWYQKLGENGDANPVLIATGANTVYHGTQCDKETDVFTNDNSIFGEDGSIPHNYEIANVADANGLYGDVCTECNANNESVKYIQNFCGENGNNIKLTVETDGSYTATDVVKVNDANGYDSPVDFTAQKLEYTREYLGDNKWQAVYVPFETQATDWIDNGITVASINNFHEYEKEDGSGYETVLEVKKATSGVFEANTPYVVRSGESGNDSKTITIHNVKLYKAESKNYYCMSMTRKYDFTGIYTPQNGLGQDESAAVYALDKQGRIAPLKSETTLGAQRWYLTVSDRNGSSLPQDTKSRTIRIDMIGDGATTGIKDVQVITSNETDNIAKAGIYDLQGRKLNKEPTHGIYIKNGKKYVK